METDPSIKRILVEAGAPGAEVTAVTLHRGEKRLCVSIASHELIPPHGMELIEQGFKRLVPDCTFDITYQFDDINELLQQDFDNTAETLKACWYAFKPTLRPAIAGSRWEPGTGGGVCVHIESPLLPLVNANGNVSGYLARLEKLYGTAPGLTLLGDLDAPDGGQNAQAQQIENKPVQSAEKPAPNAYDPAPETKKQPEAKALMGKLIPPGRVIAQSEITEQMGSITIQGAVLSMDERDRREGGWIVTAAISDRTGSTTIKLFIDAKEKKLRDALRSCADSGGWLRVRGRYDMDNWLRRMCMYPKDVNLIPEVRREDIAESKRVELHLHTKMSSMDGLTDIAAAVKTAARWGHRAIAITDHGVAQAFPAAVSTADKLKKSGTDIKVLLGVEGYLLPDCEAADARANEYTALGIACEQGAREMNIFDICAIRFNEGGELSRLDIPVNCGMTPSPALIAEAGLDAERCAQGAVIKEALTRLKEFASGSILALHGADAAEMLYARAERSHVEWDDRCVNTAMLTHYLMRDEVEDYASLEAAANACGVEYGGSAQAQAQACMGVARRCFGLIVERGVSLPVAYARQRRAVKGKRSNYHIILIAKNQQGLKNLYALVSYSHLEYLKKVPQIPKSLLLIHRPGIIAGSACEAGEVFRAVLEDAPEEELDRIAALYDYLEIQPIGNNAFLVREGRVENDDGLRALNRRIVELAERLNKPVVATGDVHFLEPEDAIFRAILMHARDFKDAEQQAPLYFKTTDEMLAEFAYLGEEKARQVVVEAPNAIADMCERMKPFLDEKRTYAPTFPGANDELSGMALSRARELYGDPLPEPVQARLDKELGSIIGNGYASLYLMAQRLVHKSMSDGYLVGSRGSVGSSLVATMAGITEVNPLPPHYVCKCTHSEFDVDSSKYHCGVDMPDKLCPVCGAPMDKAGYEIPFEVFLGFKGDKTPDIDLNFSGEYQSKAHEFTEVMFGRGHAFRAGTISGLQEKTAYGYVKKYCDENGITLNREETDRLVAGCSGVKRTTGQHPGGIVIVPEDHDILEFTPVQYPADKSDTDTVTTHFDFHALDDRLVKLDILGHDDPTALRMLEDMTGVDPRDIPLDDPDTMRLFSSAEPLGVTLEELDCDVGSIAIPEFGTGFVRQMLHDTRPTTMEELVRIAGLSHGTNVWLGNAQDLVLSGTATLRDVICTRDDIMNYLIAMGGDPSLSFKTMESVRKGRGLTPEMERAMLDINVPDWFVDSCKKIKYMFPRAHAAAYVMMAFRVAYHKVHNPLEFYTVYYTVRADAFDIAYALGGESRVLANIKALQKKGADIEPKEQDLLVKLEVVYEMNRRGIELLPVDMARSAATRFAVENGAIRPPLSAVAGVGKNAAESIAAARDEAMFISAEDLRIRGKANTAVIAALKNAGCIEDMPESNQLSLF